MAAIAMQNTVTEPDPRFAGAGCLFFCIGAMKSGTTWLNDYFADHPDVRVPGIKETHYWDTIRPPYRSRFRTIVEQRSDSRRFRNSVIRLIGSREQKNREREWDLWRAALNDGNDGHRAYADLLFHNSGNAKAVGEITPAYAVLGRETLTEMAGLAPGTRFLFVMRDPVDRLIANTRHRLRGELGATGVTQAAVTDAVNAAMDDDSQLELARSRYDVTIGHLDAIVPETQVSYHFFETLFRQEELDRIAAFLNISARPGNFENRSNAGVGGEISIDAGTQDRLRQALAPAYDLVAERFGDRVPDTWSEKG